MSWLLPLIPFVFIASTDIWVYSDAKAQYDSGTPVVFTIGSFRLEQPVGWVAACTLMWIIFFPLYLVGRRG